LARRDGTRGALTVGACFNSNTRPAALAPPLVARTT
jgi:hypothetical protein